MPLTPTRAAERMLAQMERRLLASRLIVERSPDAQSAHEYIAALEAEGSARRELFGTIGDARAMRQIAPSSLGSEA